MRVWSLVHSLQVYVGNGPAMITVTQAQAVCCHV